MEQALDKLTDQTLLADIVTSADVHYSWRFAALDKLNDTALLTEIAEKREIKNNTAVESGVIFESVDSYKIIGSIHTEYDIRDQIQQKLLNPNHKAGYKKQWREWDK